MIQTKPRALLHVVGARPNFMKLAPVHLAIGSTLPQKIVHTGQHYDRGMSGDFFDILGLPDPDFNLGIGSGSHVEQMAKAMLGISTLLHQEPVAAVVVYGDVNSTAAAAIAAARMCIPCLHVEAGLRSRDRSMPEEQNRVVTDQLSDALFTHSREADSNLLQEGIDRDRIFFVGNVMIDTLQRMLPAVEQARGIQVPDRFALVTLHRPSNVDDPTRLRLLANYLRKLSTRIPIVFPMHPRTRGRLTEAGIQLDSSDVLVTRPLNYLDFIALQKRASVVITDSGGVQEETTFLGTPCLTLRANTERPVTIEAGTNTLVGEDPEALGPALDSILAGTYKRGKVPEYWDGKAGQRIAEIVCGMQLVHP